MKPNEMKDLFRSYMAIAVEAKESAKMQILATTYTDLFDKVADVHPDLAAATLAMLTPIEYNNYVSPEEAMTVAAKFINDDTKVSTAAMPSKGAHWSMDVLKSFLNSRNIPLEEKPYYNWPALWLTVNMIYSDYADTLSELIGSKDNERLATAVYKMAVKKLKDLDRPSYIRSYFGL